MSTKKGKKIKKPSIVTIYLNEHEKYTQQYDKDYTLVLMQIGGFYEMYATADRGPDLESLSSLLDLQKTRKTKDILEVSIANPWLMGFPTGAISKYKRKLIEAGWTVVVIDQITPPPDVKRKLEGIYSPAVCVDDSICGSDSNNLVSIYISDEDNILNIGLVTTDVSAGKSTVHEVCSTKSDEKIALDETYRWLTIYSPKEIIVSIYKYSKNKDKIEKYIRYLELEKKIYHIKKEIPTDYYKLNFQNNYFEKIWPTKGGLDPIQRLDMEKMPFAIISLIVLLEFVVNHDEKLIKQLPLPVIYDNKTSMILGNDAPLQLNVLENTSLEYRKKGNRLYKSLLDVIGKTSTSSGKRALKELLLNPMVDSKIIEQKYEYVEELKKNFSLFKDIELLLQEICDIERLHRKISLSTLPPIDFVKLDSSYESIIQIMDIVIKNPVLKKMNIDILKKELSGFVDMYKKIINMTEANKYILTDMNGSFFKKGYSKKIDKIQELISESKEFMDNVCVKLSDYIDEEKKVIHGKEQELIKMNYNDRNGYFLELTKKRAKNLKDNLKKVLTIKITENYKLKTKDLEFKEHKKEKTKILFDELDTVSDNRVEAQKEISVLLTKEWTTVLQQWYLKYEKMFHKIVKFVSEIDIIKSNAKAANEYNYIRPIIVHDKTKGFLEGTNLRHPIIERLCVDTEYIPHNVSLGKDVDGILLFGINGVGKSSLMKTIGLLIIMAQSGMYVPATKFKYSPYNALYARITGNDNLFKGLSSFELEMVELKSIIKRANKKTLIIGDEICRGTEWISGTSIVASTIEILAKRNVSFIFATHLHKIIELPQIKELTNIRTEHLTVEIDKKNDCLIFDRELKQGSGPNIYGLTVAKHILDNKEFIDKANVYKQEIINAETTDITKKSKYNPNLYLEKCTICKMNVQQLLDTHHINFQSKCKNGFSTENPHVAKNEKYNLVILCKKCHIDVHNKEIIINGWKKTTNGIMLDYYKNVIVTKKEYDIITKLKKDFQSDDYTKTWALEKTSKDLKTKGVYVTPVTIKKIWINKLNNEHKIKKSSVKQFSKYKTI
jgi:DNA mismatch repair protein MutS